MTESRSVSTKLGKGVRLVRRICESAGAPNIIDDARVGLALHGVIAAVQRRNAPVLFDWLIDALSYQGASDSIAYGYMEQHGRVRWHDITAALADEPSCPKLRCYWAFEGCGYRKGSGSCANPEHQPTCPLPRHDLRNGRLNQTAYSLFLFMRDLAEGDFVGWIDDRLAGIGPDPVSNRPARLRQALIEPMGHVYGVSNKVLAMALSELLLAGDAKRAAWIEAGTVMIAIDTLVHNFLHRTGILRDFRADHPYGPRCYAPNGCAAIIERIAGKIDARRFVGGITARAPQSIDAADEDPVHPLADMFKTEAINTADALWVKVEVGTVALAAQPDLYGPGWREGVVVGVDGDDLTIRWMDDAGLEPIHISRRDVALRHPGAD